MSQIGPNPEIADEVPWAKRVTAYDKAHLVTYLCLLNASGDGLSEDEMARTILGMDPVAEPRRARAAVNSHLKRALWMTESGYQTLLDN